MRTADFNYELPAELIAQHPLPERDASRLLVVKRATRVLEHRHFVDLPSLLQAEDLLVVNNSKVLPARLRATKLRTGGAIEVLLVEEVQPNEWWTMLKPGKRVRPGTILQFRAPVSFSPSIQAEVREKSVEGHYRLLFRCESDIKEHLDQLGEIPLPPYIQRPSGPGAADGERYQTVFAQPPGSVAAPTAGLHFTPPVLAAIRARGVNIAEVTLHVGLGTFAPVKAESLDAHVMHEERYDLPENTARMIQETKSRGGRVIAVGTTSLRVLESVAARGGMVPGKGRTRIFIHPPYTFKVVDALLTNFHLPESTLLMLVSAFAAPGESGGREFILKIYEEAVRQRYRFFSYGDAMLIL